MGSPHRQGVDLLSNLPDLTRAEYVSMALQILAPIGEQGVRIFCVETEGRLKPRSVGRGRALKGTRWSGAAAYALSDLGSIPLMIDRIGEAVQKNVQRLVNPLVLHRLGQQAELSNVRTLLWTTALDAIVMAGNRAEFCTRLGHLLGRENLIFPPNKNGIQPRYTVGELVEGLYELRSLVAHGRQLSQRFLEVDGFLDTNGSAISPDYTVAQVLEETALFMLSRVLRLILTTECFSEIANESTWRRRLKGQTQTLPLLHASFAPDKAGRT